MGTGKNDSYAKGDQLPCMSYEQCIVSYLVEDGKAVPTKALNQGHEGGGYQLGTWVQVDRVAIPLHHEVPTRFLNQRLILFWFKTYTILYR